MALPTGEDLAKALEEISGLSQTSPETPDEGFGNLSEWGEALGLAERQVRRRLSLGIKAGTMEKKFFRVKIPDGRIVRLPHWRWIPESERSLLSPKDES